LVKEQFQNEKFARWTGTLGVDWEKARNYFSETVACCEKCGKEKKTRGVTDAKRAVGR